MRHVMILGLVLAVASPAAVLAQGPDTIGLWFDPGYTVNIGSISVNTPIQAYLVLHDPSAPSVSGLDYVFGISDNMVLVLASSFSHDPVVQVEGGCTQVSYATPLPPAPAILINTLDFIVISPVARVLFTVTACPGQACPVYYDANMQPICMATSLGGGVVACLGECSVGTESVAWSSIKRLYR